MKNSLLKKSIPLNLSYCFILFFIAVSNNVKANDAIIFGSMQKIGNLNPFSYTSCPAELIVQLTTERLIKRVCYDFNQPSSGYMSDIINDKKFIRDYKPFESVFYLDEMQNGICFLDINYTIKQINQTSTNRYHNHFFKFLENRIRIENPSHALFSKAASALTFPIIKSEKLPQNIAIIDNECLTLYNSATTGLYCLKSIQPNTIELEGRTQSYRPLIFKTYDTWEQFITNILKGKIHIALGISGNLLHQINTLDQYLLEDSDDLKSFTYFGFNYNTPNYIIRKLFIDLEFRQAFAYAICSISDIREILYQYGDPNDHTFDHIRFMENYPVDYMYASPGIIEGLIQSISIIKPKSITIQIIFKPDFIFGQQRFNSIIRELNKLFLQARIQFEPVVVQNINEFEKMKKNSNFEMIFETFTFGQNQLRYIEFLNPLNSESNFLNCKKFHHEEIERSKYKIEERDRFLLKVNKELPVFVLGSFKRMNAISKRILRKNLCQGKNALPVPFSNVHEWQMAPK